MIKSDHSSLLPAIKKGFIILWIALAAIPLSARENSSFLYRDGAILASKGDIDNAIPLFTRAVLLSPRSALAHYGLGRALLYKEGKRRDAIHELRLSVECDKKLAKGYFYLGFALMFDKKYEYAIDAFNTAFRTDKSYTEALYNIGSIYDIMGHQGKSGRYFAEYFRLIHPDKHDLF
jgi:tetratricopeptide (TPR) repeat protein